MPDMERNSYDLSHFVHQCGKIGRLQTLCTIPTVPGDSFDIDIDGVLRLAPLRKEVVQESQVDLFAFWIPNRHIYGDTWNQYVQEGVEANLSGLATTAFPLGFRDANYLLQPFAPASLPALLARGYNQIWDRYFRVPSQPRDPNDDVIPTTSTPDDTDWRKYGRRCARLRHPTNLGLKTNTATPRQPWRDLTSADYTVDVPISGPNALLDLRALDQVKGRYKSEIQRTWFTDRYQDVLQRQWGSSVNIDADQRPELVWRDTQRLGGHDVDGTDDATLGQYTGKTIGGIKVQIPRKHYPEHGMLWVMALVRWPTIHVAERHPITKVSTWTPAQVFGDPDVYATRAPELVDPTDYIAEPYSVAGDIPDTYEAYGNMYRVHPNFVHKNFNDIPGYPFIKYTFSAGGAALLNWYIVAGEYDDIFQTSQLAHWQMHTSITVNALRYIPDPQASIFAGT